MPRSCRLLASHPVFKDRCRLHLIETDDLLQPLLRRSLHLAFEVFGAEYAPILLGASALAIFWGIMFWMYHRKIFIRI